MSKLTKFMMLDSYVYKGGVLMMTCAGKMYRVRLVIASDAETRILPPHFPGLSAGMLVRFAGPFNGDYNAQVKEPGWTGLRWRCCGVEVYAASCPTCKTPEWAVKPEIQTDPGF